MAWNFFKKKDVYDELAKELGVEKALLQAFVKAESNGTNSIDDRVVIRWESHIFKRKTGVVIKVHGKRGRITEECQNNEYEAFNRAKDLLEDGKYEDEAYESASYGMGQIMGFNHTACGFDNAQELKEFIEESDDNAIRAIAYFIKSNRKLLQACKDLDFPTIARKYNGPAYAKNKYDIKMEKYYNEFKSA